MQKFSASIFILAKCYGARCRILIAFLSSYKVIMQFVQISHDVSSGEVDNGINLFIIYFRKNFIAGEDRVDPLYDITFWNCHHRVLNSIIRTTNSLEGWHRSLNNSFDSSHPNLAIFIDVLSKEEQRFLC